MKTGGWRYCLAEPACLASAPVINILVDCSQWQSLYFRQRRKLGGFRRIAQRFYRPVLGSPYTLRLGNWLLMCDNFTIVFSARVLM